MLFTKSAGLSADWEKTNLWRTAAAIPGVTVITDGNSAEAKKFGAETSGQTLLFDRAGKLLFSGGITASRGHFGDNANNLLKGFSQVTRDITERKKAEDAILQANDELEHRVSARTEELATANRRLHAAKEEAEQANRAIVDDEPLNLVLLTEILEPFGYTNLKTQTSDERRGRQPLRLTPLRPSVAECLESIVLPDR